MKLHYIECGSKEKPLLVFLHGGGVGGWMWERQMQYFSSNYHCIAPDLPGHGLSESTSFSIHDSAVDVIHLIQSMGQDKPIVLVGFSLGSQIAIEVLSLDSDLIDYAIINSALCRPIPYARKIIGPAIKLTHGLTRNRYFAKLQAKQLYIGEAMFETYYADTCKMNTSVLIDVLQENMSFQVDNNFSNTNSKVLVTVGAQEKKIMKESAMDLVNMLPGCKGVVISRVGHGVPLAEPELFNEMVEAWIHDRELPDRLLSIKMP
ncbi:AB hydrolase superfamily protein YdjP [compost metagenome]